MTTSTAGLVVWCANAQQVVDDSHPCDAARYLQDAIKFINDLVNERDALQEKNRQRVAKDLLAAVKKMEIDLPIGSRNPLGREPRIWRMRIGDADLEGVTEVQDYEGNVYVRDAARNGWSPRENDGTLYTSVYGLDYLIDNYGPIVEIGENVKKIRWFEDEVTEDFRLPEDVEFIEDGEGDLWFRAYSKENLWGLVNWSPQETKRHGYWSLGRIAKSYEAIMINNHGRAAEPLVFETGEDVEPHKTILVVHNPKTNWYYRRNENGMWYAPNVPNQSERIHGKVELTWEELLSHAGVLTELRR